MKKGSSMKELEDQVIVASYRARQVEEDMIVSKHKTGELEEQVVQLKEQMLSMQQDFNKKHHDLLARLDSLSALMPIYSLQQQQPQEMEISLVGLQNGGKTSLVNSIATEGYTDDMIPTLGYNMRKVTKGNVTIKIWDLGMQGRFRTLWESYCRGVSAILYVVDAGDRDKIPIARSQLQELLTKPSLNGIPLLVLGNKIDKSEALSKLALVDQLCLESIADRETCCYMISCKDTINIDVVIDWLIKHSKAAE